MSVAEVIRAAMDRKGLKQLGLAEAVGVAQPTVQRWISGKRSPEMEIIPRLAEVLEVERHLLIDLDFEKAGLAPVGEVAEVLSFYTHLTDGQKRLVAQLAEQLSDGKKAAG